MTTLEQAQAYYDKAVKALDDNDKISKEMFKFFPSEIVFQVIPEPTIKVKVVIGNSHIGGNCATNILWGLEEHNKWKSLPANHPAILGISDFRATGYWASCFPEGDGITLMPGGDNSVSKATHPEFTEEKILKDIRECFSFEITEVQNINR